MKYAPFPGNLVMVGFGSVGQAVLPVLLKHLEIRPGQIGIIAADDAGADIARKHGVELTVRRLTEEDYQAVLEPRLKAGDFLLNLSVDVASLALVELCWRRGALYLDTCIEPWPGGYDDPSRTPSQRSNYALREEILAFRRHKGAGPTAIPTQGANPGLASLFVKQALLDMAGHCRLPISRPASYEDWAELARRLDIKVIHIAERDTQTSARRKEREEFVNTWSVMGFVGEGQQPAELGWGTHERHWPADAGRHGYGCDA
ncbi:MAG TPA: saccharopine dehydrogenase NADP-binding domain-containing protein, partial [Rhodocyclaceae bacterium]|nr:saccharopine dehydrogenase NADP-binding domain-containing protein [Rhodocyclaceae bacterium]